MNKAKKLQCSTRGEQGSSPQKAVAPSPWTVQQKSKFKGALEDLLSDGKLTFGTAKDVTANMYHAVEALAAALIATGYAEMILKSDQEPAIVDVKRAADRVVCESVQADIQLDSMRRV